MWLVAFALSGAVAGFIAGMVLSEVISLIGYLLIHKPFGVPYLSLYVAGVGAVAGLLIARRRPEVPNNRSSGS